MYPREIREWKGPFSRYRHDTSWRYPQIHQNSPSPNDMNVLTSLHLPCHIRSTYVINWLSPSEPYDHHQEICGYVLGSLCGEQSYSGWVYTRFAPLWAIYQPYRDVSVVVGYPNMIYRTERPLHPGSSVDRWFVYFPHCSPTIILHLSTSLI